MTTIESTSAAGGIDLEDPLRIAEELRDEFRAGAAERDRERRFPYEQCAAFTSSRCTPATTCSTTGCPRSTRTTRRLRWLM